jgi:alpha-mannosidase
VLDTRDPLGSDRFYASVSDAHAVLSEGIVQAGTAMPVSVAAAGHAHIDVAWLWTLGQTRRKAGRTFHSVVNLMDSFPEFHFTQSKPQLYDYVRQDYPELFSAIQQHVKRGQWEPIGGMWVEADCNLTGGESLARQFLLGRDFFRQHFGENVDSPVLWLPDVFGYAWNLPQLIKEAGLDYFFTIKISWNQYNRLPYDSFWWQGLDGTRVLTHFSTTPGHAPGEISTYNAHATPDQIMGTWRNFQQKESQRELFMAFGFGDGGGGPTREMLENLAILNNFPSMPRVRQTSAVDFFRKLEAESGQNLPVWNGELYLEFHRGTYTAQARNKRANRKSEFLLHDAEFLATVAASVEPEYRYPQVEIRRAWELICLNQFHDIIPGSSIHEVYVDSQRDYAEIQQLGNRICTDALRAIGNHIGGDVLLVNPTSFSRDDLIFIPKLALEGEILLQSDDTPVRSQPTDGGVWVAAHDLMPYSITPLKRLPGEATDAASELSVTPRSLENDYLRIELDDAGDIVRICDKQHGRQVLAPGAGANQFQAFEDRTHTRWDAWDVEIYYDDRCWYADPADDIRVVEMGPLRGTIEIRRRILNSTYVQRISLSFNSARIDFQTQIDCRERHILLKVAFPVDAFSPLATYEIQWGNVQRPTHRNTSWDWARFETCAHKWVDLSEGDYGVSLLNDCKYGHDIAGNVMRLSLLRSPEWPDPEADQGEHEFTYSLFPHAGSWDHQTIRQAYLLNDPVLTFVAGDAGERVIRSSEITRSWVKVDHPNVIVETIKRAEDGNGFILRLYEAQRQRGLVRVATGMILDQVWRTNLLEENQTSCIVKDNGFEFFIKAYQIMTFRLIPTM